MRLVVPALGLVLAVAFAGPDARAEDRPPVQAREGSVSVGGGVSNSTITIGVPPEKLDELVRLRTKDLSDLCRKRRLSRVSSRSSISTSAS
jgi:hypothetical protein